MLKSHFQKIIKLVFLWSFSITLLAENLGGRNTAQPYGANLLSKSGGIPILADPASTQLPIPNLLKYSGLSNELKQQENTRQDIKEFNGYLDQLKAVFSSILPSYLKPDQEKDPLRDKLLAERKAFARENIPDPVNTKEQENKNDQTSETPTSKELSTPPFIDWNLSPGQLRKKAFGLALALKYKRSQEQIHRHGEPLMDGGTPPKPTSGPTNTGNKEVASSQKKQDNADKKEEPAGNTQLPSPSDQPLRWSTFQPAPGWSVPEWKPYPLPPQQPELLVDPFFQQLQDENTSIQVYRSWVSERKAAEAQGKEFTFPPLRTTLLNMQAFTTHILQGLQFDNPLTTEEYEAFNKMLLEINQLLALPEPPYKRTVWLSHTFTVLYDFTIFTKVQSQLEKRGYFQDYGSYNIRDYAIFYRDITLQEINQLFVLSKDFLKSLPDDKLDSPHLNEWLSHGKTAALSLVKADSNANSSNFTLDTWRGYLSELFRHLNNPELLLYPSYQPLDLDNFALFGHLPFYPLGMISEYFLNADGTFASPLQFYLHDVRHINLYYDPETVDLSQPLAATDRRLTFRQAVMHSEVYPQKPEVMKARFFILFFLFHEPNLRKIQECLSHKSALQLYGVITNTRVKQHWFSQAYQGINLHDMALAVLWTHRVYGLWVSKGQAQLSNEELVEFYEAEFLSQAESLLTHLAITDYHGEFLLTYFKSSNLIPKNGDYKTSQSTTIRAYDPGSPSTGCPEINSCDVVYLDWISDPDKKALLEKLLQIALPECFSL